MMSGKLKRSGICLILMVLCVLGIFAHLRVIFGEESALLKWSIDLPEISVASVRSGSMSPELKVGDLVLIAESDHYQTGDIVETIGENQSPILHRLIIYEPYANIALTQGDANSVPDETIRCSAIKGKLLLKISGIGAVIEWFQTTTGRLILTAAAFLLFLSVLWSAGRQNSAAYYQSHPAACDAVHSENCAICFEKAKKRKIRLIVGTVIIFCLLTLGIFAVSQISAVWRSGASGTFSMQARPLVTETDSFGIDEVYVRVE